MSRAHFEKILEGSLNYLDTLLVYQDGRRTVEFYKYPDTKNTGIDLRSLTKTIITTLLGIAIDKGVFRGVEDSVKLFFPDYSVSPELKIKHLLLHQSGVIDPMRSGITDVNSVQLLEFLFQQMNFRLGLPFNYSGGNTHIISALIARGSGQSTFEFAQHVLFEPLGMKVAEWPCDKEGFHLGFCPDLSPGLKIRANDLLNLGILYLNEGDWEGKRILSREWINLSTTSKISAEWARSNGYGYHWWITEEDEGRLYSAKGNGGQRIHVIPSRKMVVVCAAPYRNWRDKMNDPDKELFKALEHEWGGSN
ncbi:serine hydrolase domain-containing protein [Paenibacillus glacialis]|uniref:Beta-lactamase-related domain-containing protein n=1 Tax=Paenibacillus glacialis TaxID=494026 RepID=A0A168D0T6_9BACL|nr:serine hydrolase [Paenibacillus glacialis]OAB33776.1 hypothetical protein PGLA_22850 [Paenibacillus glacialis]